MICEHIFKLNIEGEVRCVLCNVPDDELELPGQVYPSSGQSLKNVDEDFWSSQVSFE